VDLTSSLTTKSVSFGVLPGSGSVESSIYSYINIYLSVVNIITKKTVMFSHTLSFEMANLKKIKTNAMKKIAKPAYSRY